MTWKATKVLSRSWLLLTAVVPFAACGRTASESNPDAGLAGRCALPADPGNCLAYAPAYYHDARTGICTPFVYGGCGGNDNRFTDQGDCEAACAGGAPDFGSCSVPSDCVLATPGCCASCDPVDLTAFVAVNRSHAAAYTKAIGCEGVACGPCPEVPVEEKTSGYFAATCRHGRCVVLDVRTTPATECKPAVDCHLRLGARCCEGCDPQEIIAISSEETLSEFVCDPTPTGCPACAPQIPREYTSTCEEGQCRVARRP